MDDRIDLRYLLAEGDVQGGGDQVRDAERDRQGGAVRDRRTEDIFEQARDRRLAEEADAERGHGDSELAGGQVLVDAIDLFERERGAAAAGVAELLNPSLRGAHECELRGDEESVQRDQNGDAEQEQELGHLRPLSREARAELVAARRGPPGACAKAPFLCLLRGGSSSLMR